MPPSSAFSEKRSVTCRKGRYYERAAYGGKSAVPSNVRRGALSTGKLSSPTPWASCTRLRRKPWLGVSLHSIGSTVHKPPASHLRLSLMSSCRAHTRHARMVVRTGRRAGRASRRISATPQAASVLSHFPAVAQEYLSPPRSLTVYQPNSSISYQ